MISAVADDNLNTLHLSMFLPHPSLFRVSFHTSPAIYYASLMLSFPHWEPTWRPITLLDNAHHKSSIGLSDRWGLSTTENMLLSIFFSSFYSPFPSFDHSFLSLLMNYFKEIYVASSLPYSICISTSVPFVVKISHWFVFVICSSFMLIIIPFVSLTFHLGGHLFLSFLLLVLLP